MPHVKWWCRWIDVKYRENYGKAENAFLQNFILDDQSTVSFMDDFWIGMIVFFLVMDLYIFLIYVTIENSFRSQFRKFCIAVYFRCHEQHFQDVARVESKTWMITPDKYQSVCHTPEGVKPIMGQWMSPETLGRELDARFPGCMAGKSNLSHSTSIQVIRMQFFYYIRQ